MTDYTIRNHAVYGRYVDVRDFQTSKNTDSEAINDALAVAHKEKAALYLSGTLRINQVIEINDSTRNVSGIFGDGMGKTKVIFTHKQTGVHNANSNDTEPEKAGIWINKQSGKFVADLSVQYGHTATEDFYRKGQSYFGKVNGIVVNDSSNTLISKVEVSGANRAGVLFTSTDAVSSGAKSALVSGDISESQLPVGNYNKVVDSYLHHNRVAGVLVAYQRSFKAEGNTLAWNGHKDDGGTGYGIATQAGSYNNGVSIINNTTDHNYRKGIDSHDGNNIIIQNNTLNGDRLYGISVENRQFSMGKAVIQGNTITQDASFRLASDDNLGKPGATSDYNGFRAIKLENKAQTWQDFAYPKNGSFTISGNTINNITDGEGITRAIEVRNNEQEVTYTLNIADNVIKGRSADNLIGIFGNSDNTQTGIRETGQGSGTIKIRGNIMAVDTIAASPVYIEEQNTDGSLHGRVLVTQNKLSVANSDGATEGLSVVSNAESVLVSGNTFNLGGEIDRPVVRVSGLGKVKEGTLSLLANKFVSEEIAVFGNSDWLKTENMQQNVNANTHGLTKLPDSTDAAGIGGTTVSKAAAENIVINQQTLLRVAGSSKAAADGAASAQKPSAASDMLDSKQTLDLGNIGLAEKAQTAAGEAEYAYDTVTVFGTTLLDEEGRAAV